MAGAMFLVGAFLHCRCVVLNYVMVIFSVGSIFTTKMKLPSFLKSTLWDIFMLGALNSYEKCL
jgi:hypothetical protein